MRFESYEQVEQAVWDVVEREIIQGRFMQTLLRGEFTARQIAEFALQYSYYSRSFPRTLGAAIMAMKPEDDWWVPLVDNLWDEGGRGDPMRYHSRLYWTFLTTAAPDVPCDGYAPRYPVSPAVEDAVNTLINFLKYATPLEAMAAIGLGSEMFAGKVMGMIGEALTHPNYNQKQKLDVRFWTVHADEHEPRHYQLCKDVLVRHTQPEELEAMYRAGSYIARSEARMYDGIYERMMAC